MIPTKNQLTPPLNLQEKGAFFDEGEGDEFVFGFDEREEWIVLTYIGGPDFVY